MTQIILNDDQVRTLREATDTVQVCDKSGIPIGYLARSTKATPEEIAEARRRLSSDGPWRTTAEVLDRLRRAGSE
jgi:hypothetical protein